MFRLASAVLRRPPEWSVGPAQLDYSTLKKLKATENVGLKELTGDCTNITNAFAVVRMLYQESEGSPISRRIGVIRAYNGQRTDSFSNAAYVAVALAAYDALATPETSELCRARRRRERSC